MKPPMNYPASVSNTAMLLDKSSGKPKVSQTSALMGVPELKAYEMIIGWCGYFEIRRKIVTH